METNASITYFLDRDRDLLKQQEIKRKEALRNQNREDISADGCMTNSFVTYVNNELVNINKDVFKIALRCNKEKCSNRNHVRLIIVEDQGLAVSHETDEINNKDRHYAKGKDSIIAEDKRCHEYKLQYVTENLDEVRNYYEKVGSYRKCGNKYKISHKIIASLLK